MINLSTYKLSPKLFPDPKSNIGELKKELKEFKRKFRLLEKVNDKKIHISPGKK